MKKARITVIITRYDLSCFSLLRRLIRTQIAIYDVTMIRKGMRKPTINSYVIRDVKVKIE